MLLAALGRVLGIPTRVVTGLVYADEFEGKRMCWCTTCGLSFIWTMNG